MYVIIYYYILMLNLNNDNLMNESVVQNDKSVFFQTFGCQMNKLDSELSTGLLVSHGYSIVNDIDDANIILYNTCSVRGHAEEKVYSHLGALRKRKVREEGLIIGVLGCMAQKDGKKVFNRAPYVNLVCGTRMFHKLPEFLDSILLNGKRILATDEDQYVSIPRPAEQNAGFQSFVSIMRGCDNYCTYCIVPYVRGRETSREIEAIVDEVKMVVDNGTREITLLGQNVNSYGKGLKNDVDLAVLLETLSSIEKLDRIRFITSHPKDMSEGILKVIRDNPKVCKYLHLPAQSGSDRILSNMNRKYTSTYYRDLVSLARQFIPDISISSDFIIGFPGESDRDFDETIKLVEDLKFFNCFIFKYSKRTGTVAAKLEDDVPEKVKKERNRILLEIQEKITRENNINQIGKTFDVLVEKQNSKDISLNLKNVKTGRLNYNLFGRTEYNHITIFDGENDLIGRFAKVEIVEATNLTLFGKQLCF